ncbi:AraC family transcriptional regulator [Rhizobium sp. L1K21]|uniref:AraC family transcriptional regulator n=1 Tax=Rhizobium sp. L1K21 TaxID=2954933 RepID=UPI0020939222|nr:AraC family transcriptional regulator [Rhizobium sp. L1K21]MCO6185570.1 AraC family transcriptional regulator [Rhizobium sp. L1K21]
MKPEINETFLSGLGRLCESPQASGITAARDAPGMSRIGAHFFGKAYSPHRHDTYSLGITVSGVQTFSYRGVSRFSTPGNLIILHPDELHDGGAGTEDGLVYRMLYLEPSALRQALGNDASPLPFVANPVISDEKLKQALLIALADLETDMDDLATSQLLADIADGLTRHATGKATPRTTLNHQGTEAARAYLNANLQRAVTSADLEAASGMDRFTLARHFRALYATSPHRYLIMRRLEKARQLMLDGMPLTETAFATGFADQSHFTRQFKKAYGMTPGVWNSLTSVA